MNLDLPICNHTAAPSDLSFQRVAIRAYPLPRAIFVIIASAMTCALIKHLLPQADPTIFGVAGVSWGCGGFAYFVYLRKLRREIEDLQRNRRYSTGGRTT